MVSTVEIFYYFEASLWYPLCCRKKQMSQCVVSVFQYLEALLAV